MKSEITAEPHRANKITANPSGNPNGNKVKVNTDQHIVNPLTTQQCLHKDLPLPVTIRSVFNCTVCQDSTEEVILFPTNIIQFLKD